MAVKIASGLIPFANVVDRYLPGGYRDGIPFEEQLQRAREIEGLDGLGFDYPLEFDDPVKLQTLLQRYGFELSVVEVGLYGERRWKMGSLASTDREIRRQAVELIERCMDIAATLGGVQVLLWPGQDGFEYPFQVNYDRAWGYLVEGIGEAAAYRPEIKIGIEYKPKEPRVRCHIDTAAKALLLCKAIDLPNVGVTVDLGHSLLAQENPGQAVALCTRHQRLFQVHVNDNYGDWDSDLVTGQVNLWAAVEFFYWLRQTGYEGWYEMDFFPYREDGAAALTQCIRNTRRLAAIAERLAQAPLAAMQEAGDPVAIGEWLWREVIRP